METLDALWFVVGGLMLALLYLWGIVMYQITFEAFIEHSPKANTPKIRPRDRVAFVKSKRPVYET